MTTLPARRIVTDRATTPAEVDVDEAVGVAAALTAAAVAVFDGQLHLVAHSAATSDDLAWRKAVLERDGRHLVGAPQRRRITAEAVSVELSGGHVALGLRAEGLVIGFLVVHAGGDLAVPEDAMRILTQALQRRLDGAFVQQRANALRALLDGAGDGAALGVDGHRQWRVLAITGATAVVSEGAVRRAVSTAFCDLTAPVTTAGSNIYALVANRSDLRAAVQRLRGRLPTQARFGVGSAFTQAPAAAESRFAADAVLTNGDAVVAWADDQMATVLLAAVRTVLKDLAHLRPPELVAIAEHDARTDSSLLETLSAWLANDGDVAATASALQLHPNTVRYRVRRACMLSGLDLNDPVTRLAAAIALHCGLMERISRPDLDPETPPGRAQRTPSKERVTSRTPPGAAAGQVPSLRHTR